MYEKTSKPMLYASEIGQYHFCPVAWYLQKCGYSSNSPMLEQGIKKHKHFGHLVKKKEQQQKLMEIYFILGILGLVGTVILFLFEVMV